MKNNLARLQFINVDLFYVVSFRDGEITLQGSISSELIKYCTNELGATLQGTENGWLQGGVETIELGNLKITLT